MMKKAGVLVVFIFFLVLLGVFTSAQFPGQFHFLSQLGPGTSIDAGTGKFSFVGSATPNLAPVLEARHVNASSFNNVRGVYGYVQNSGSNSIGVLGESNQIGVQGKGNGIGIWGLGNSASALSGFFSGGKGIEVQGNVNVTSGGTIYGMRNCQVITAGGVPATANCPAGQQAVGGGYTCPAIMTMISTRPVGNPATGWTGTCTGPAGGAETAYAICCG